MKQEMTGAEIVLQSLVDQGVEVVFGYPGGAVLPIYDTLFKHNSIKRGDFSPLIIINNN